MSSRADKYYEDSSGIGSRTARNTELYKEINKTELDSFEVTSNATVIGNNRESIDVEKIKKILDTHYNDAPKRKSIHIDDIPKTEEIKPMFETKEYDINVILDKAKEEKTDSYEEDRAKRLRNTQFDILNNLDINPKDYVEDYDDDSSKAPEKNEKTTAEELEELINTITLNEKESKEPKVEEKVEKTSANTMTTDALDIFSDLKGSDNTAILEGLQEETEKAIEKIEQTSSLDKSFFTKSNSFKKSDFEDFQDLDEKEVKPIFKILIIILVLAFIAGIVILVKSLM